MTKTSLIVLVIALILVVAFAGMFLFQSSDKENSKGKELTPPPTPELPEETAGGSMEEIIETQPKTYNIEIKGFDFKTKELRIKVGDTIIWTNKDEASHTITSDSGNELGSTLLIQGQTYSHTFNTAGTFNYHCTPHPYMKAKIIVE